MMGKDKLFGIITKSLNKSGQFTPHEREAIALAITTAITEYQRELVDGFDELILENMLKQVAFSLQVSPDKEPLTDMQLAQELWDDLVEIRKGLTTLEGRGYVELDTQQENWVVTLTEKGKQAVRTAARTPHS